MSLLVGRIKPQISINAIGLFRFIAGIAMGIFLAFLFYCFFCVFREGLRVISVLNDILVYSDRDIFLSNLYLACYSLIFAQGLMFKVWFPSLPTNSDNRIRLRQRVIVHNSFWERWALSEVLLKIGLVYLLFMTMGYHSEMFVISTYKYFFVGLLIWFFLSQWNRIRAYYRSAKWVALSATSIVALSLIFSQYHLYDYDQFNAPYLKRYEFRHQLIESELARASRWGVHYDTNTIRTLHLNDSQAQISWYETIQKKLRDRKTTVDLKTLIVYKILTHNQYFSKYGPRRGDLGLTHHLAYHLNNMDTAINKREMQVIVEIVKEWDEIVNPPWSITDEEFRKLTLNQRIKLDHIYSYHEKSPPNWVNLTNHEILGIPEPESLFVLMEDTMPEFPDEHEIKQVLEFNKLKEEVLSNPRYREYQRVLR